MKKILLILALTPLTIMAQEWRLVWSDEFNGNGRPDEATWSYEEGFVRNHEDQWYQAANAFLQDGLLIIEGRREQRPNPTYRPMVVTGDSSGLISNTHQPVFIPAGSVSSFTDA